MTTTAGFTAATDTAAKIMEVVGAL